MPLNGDGLLAVNGLSAVSPNQFADVLKLDSVKAYQPYAPITTLAVTTEEPLPSASVPSSQVATATGQKGVLDYLKAIGDNLLGTFKTQAKATVQGAIEGATASTAGAQAGAQVGAASTGISTTMLLVIGLVVILLLRRR